METNLITPAGEKFRTFFSSQIEFCEGNACASGLLDFFDKFHAIKLKHRKINQRSNDIAEQHGDNRLQNEDLLQPHTLDELNEYLLGMFSLNAIRTALKLLQDKGVITVHDNPNPRYKFDKRAHYLFHPEAYNGWLAKSSKAKLLIVEEEMLEEAVLRLSNDIDELLAEVESNQALCEQWVALLSSSNHGPESSGLEEAILTLQQRNEHCLKVLKRLRQERERAEDRLEERKHQGEHHDKN